LKVNLVSLQTIGLEMTIGTIVERFYQINNSVHIKNYKNKRDYLFG